MTVPFGFRAISRIVASQRWMRFGQDGGVASASVFEKRDTWAIEMDHTQVQELLFLLKKISVSLDVLAFVGIVRVAALAILKR